MVARWACNAIHRSRIASIKSKKMGLATKDGRSYGDKGAQITHLDSETSSVDVVSEEKVVVFLEGATNLEYLHEIVLWGVTRGAIREAWRARTYWP